MLYPKSTGEWTSYHPPKRVGFGHSARSTDPTRAWRATREFLEAHCAYQLSGTITLKCWTKGSPTGGAASADGLEQVTATFGDPTDRHPGVSEWHLRSTAVDGAIDLCATTNRRWPHESLGPLTIDFAYVLAWKGLTADARPDVASPAARAEASVLGIGVWTRRLFLQPHFVFPLPWDSSELRRLLATLSTACPFRFRDEYFSRVLRSEDGALSRSRKLPPGWLNAD